MTIISPFGNSSSLFPCTLLGIVVENHSSGRQESVGLGCMIFWLVEVVCVAKILVWGKTGSSKYKFAFFRAMYC